MSQLVEIDRTKVCPLLLRCFWNINKHNPSSDYKKSANGFTYPANEVQVYTWPDATLRELSEILKDVIVPARDKKAVLQFSVVFLDKNENIAMRQVGRVNSLRASEDDRKTLAACRFVTGDMLDISIAAPNPNLH